MLFNLSLLFFISKTQHLTRVYGCFIRMLIIDACISFCPFGFPACFAHVRNRYCFAHVRNRDHLLQVTLNVNSFMQQFQYGVFFSYVKLKEQECRNIIWIAECIAQRHRAKIDSYIPIVWSIVITRFSWRILYRFRSVQCRRVVFRLISLKIQIVFPVPSCKCAFTCFSPE